MVQRNSRGLREDLGWSDELVANFEYKCESFALAITLLNNHVLDAVSGPVAVDPARDEITIKLIAETAINAWAGG